MIELTSYQCIIMAFRGCLDASYVD